MSPGYTGPLDPGLEKDTHKTRVSVPWPSVDEVRPEDQLLRQKIQKIFFDRPHLNALHVEVIAHEGAVYIRGLVDSYDAKATIEGLLESIDGVKEVVSYLKLNNMDDVSRSLSGKDDLSVTL